MHAFLWSIDHVNLLGTKSPASGMIPIRLEEKQRSFFPYQLWTVDDQIWIWRGGGEEEWMWVWRVPRRIVCNVNSTVAHQVSLAVSFYIEQWGFGAEWMVWVKNKWQIGAVLCKLFNQNLSAVSEL